MALVRTGYANFAAFPPTGAVDIIYVDLSNGNEYTWITSAYVAYTPTEVNVSLGFKDSAWFAANDSLLLGKGQHVYLSDGADEFINAYVIGDGVTTLDTLPWRGLKQTLQQTITESPNVNGAVVYSPNNLTSYDINDGYHQFNSSDGVDTNTTQITPTAVTFGCPSVQKNGVEVATVNDVYKYDKSTNDFRLTLTSGLAVTTTDVVNASTIYLTPYKGNVISLYDGTKWVSYESNEISLALGTLATGNYDVFCYANAGVPTLEFLAWTNATTQAVPITKLNGVNVKSTDTTRRWVGSFENKGNVSSTVTISNGTPCTITWNSNPAINNMPVVFTSTGTLPSGLVAGTTYYVASLGLIDTNTFNVSATPGGALINTTTTGSGTHTCTVPTYTEMSKLNPMLSNSENQVGFDLYRLEATTSWTYTTAAYRQSRANRANQFNIIQAVDNDIYILAQQRVAHSAGGNTITLLPAIGLDSRTAATSNYALQLAANLASLSNSLYIGRTGIGAHYIAALEFSTASGTATWYAFIMRGQILA